jgi:hypothetical protein
MPIDPAHGRDIPSGASFARVVGRFLARTRQRFYDAVRQGYTPKISPMDAQELAADLVPFYMRELELGARWSMVQLSRPRSSMIRLPRGVASAEGLIVPSPRVVAALTRQPGAPLPIMEPPTPTARVTTPIPGGTGGKFGVDLSRAFTLLQPTVRPAAEAMATNFVGELTGTTQQKVREAIRDGLTAGEPLSKIQARLMGITEDVPTVAGRVEKLSVFDRDRAITVGLTESSRARHRGQATYAQSLGSWGLEYLASSDACDLCLSLNGKQVPHGEPFYVWPKAPAEYRNVWYPPSHPNCVVGDTLIASCGIQSAIRGIYRGDVVTLSFDDGPDLTVTPNHMLLTDAGFLKAADIVKGRNVIRTPLVESHRLPNFNGPNHDHAPALARDIFDSLAVYSGVLSSKMPIAPEDLHGDAAFCDSQINVINAKVHLRDRFNSANFEPIGDSNFILRNIAGIDGSCRGDLQAMFHALLFATNGRMGIERERHAAFLGHILKSQNVGFTAVSDSQADLFHATDNSRPTDADRLRDAQNALPKVVTTSQVIAVNRRFHNGPVYDFQTAETMYLVGHGIISSNCRCTAIDVFR